MDDNSIPWSMTICITSTKRNGLHLGNFSSGTTRIGNIQETSVEQDNDLDFLMYQNVIYI